MEDNCTYPDYGMLFEEIVCKFLGRPETTIYYSSLYDNNFGCKSILYTICITNYYNFKKKFSEEQTKKLKDFYVKLEENGFDQQVVNDCIDFLHKL